jgi:CheY-like chemotaxis protein
MGEALKQSVDNPLIVVVEDEAIVLAGYQMLFESWGYRVVAANSLDDALAQLAELGEQPSFVLADYRLKEGQTGTDAIDRLRAAYGDIPGVLVTGDTAVDRLRHAAASGLPILHKPVNGRQLLDILRRSL